MTLSLTLYYADYTMPNAILNKYEDVFFVARAKGKAAAKYNMRADAKSLDVLKQFRGATHSEMVLPPVTRTHTHTHPQTQTHTHTHKHTHIHARPNTNTHTHTHKE